MNLEKIFNDFIIDARKKSIYADRKDIEEVAREALNIINNNKDATPEELVELMIKDNLNHLEDIRRKYPTPGYTVSINVSNINVKLYGGNINYLTDPMPNNALFDIASMTKFYTEVLAYNLIKEEYFSMDDKISELDNRFTNLGDLTVRDILTFAVEFRTDGRISDKKTIDEALDTLYNINVVNKGKYNYNDMGMMIMKEVMERITDKKYEDLIDEYITKPLGLNETHIIVPQKKFKLLTGSPNAAYGRINDPSALAVGGFSGHAGIFASSSDVIKLGRAVFDTDILPHKEDAYTNDVSVARGIMGSTYTSHPKGLDVSYIDNLSSTDSFAIQGSTRTHAEFAPEKAFTIMFNPSSMGVEQALIEQEKLNKTRQEKGLAPINIVKEFEFDRNGKLVKYTLIDSRQLMPSAATVEEVIKENAKTCLKLEFLKQVIDEYDKSYDKEINVEKRGM